MLEIEKRTRLARLLKSPPPGVYEELKAYSFEVQASRYGVASDQLEALLAARSDPLIDLALASYGASREVVGQVYRKGKASPTDEADAAYKQGLRLAIPAAAEEPLLPLLRYQTFQAGADRFWLIND